LTGRSGIFAEFYQGGRYFSDNGFAFQVDFDNPANLMRQAGEFSLRGGVAGCLPFFPMQFEGRKRGLY
jgi:hypothetical protein